MDNLQPQLILHYDRHKRVIDKIYFLTFMSEIELEETNCFKILTHLQKIHKYNFATTHHEIIQSHILLTLTIDEIRGFIRRLLSVTSPIVVFSIWNNIDYQGFDNEIYNPFQNIHGQKINNNPIIIDNYKGVASLGIFCYYECDEPQGSYGIERSDIFDFVDKIKNIDNTSIIRSVISTSDYRCHLNLDTKTIQSLFEIPTSMTINIFDTTNKYISGYLEILSNNDTNLSKEIVSNIKFWVDDDFDIEEIEDQDKIDTFIKTKKKDILHIINGKCNVVDANLFETFILSNDTNQLFKDRFIVGSKYVVKLNIFIDSVFLDWNRYDFLFCVPSQDKINIFFDRNRSTTIILTKTKLTFLTNTFNSDYVRYLSILIVNIFHLANQTEMMRKEIKNGNLYYSRFCQGKRKTVRRILKPNESPTDGGFVLKSSKIYEDEQGHQRYYDEATRTTYTCNNQPYRNIGVSKSVLYALNFCLYCCFKKKKETGLIQHCIDNIPVVSQIDPYIKGLNNYKFIIDPGHIGLLHGALSDLFNRRPEVLKRITSSRLKTGLNTTLESLIECHDGVERDARFEIDNDVFTIIKNYILHDGKNTTNDIYPRFMLLERQTKTMKLQMILSDLDNYLVLNKTGRIELAKNYVVYMADLLDDEDRFDVNDKLDIKETTDIYFINDTASYSNKLLLLWKEKKIKPEDIQLRFVWNKKTHNFKVINKDARSSIVVSDFPTDVKTRIVSKILSMKLLSFSIEYDEYLFNDIGFFCKQRRISIPKVTEHFLLLPQYLRKPGSLGHYIETIYKRFFSTIIVKDKVAFIETFMWNIKRVVDEFDYNHLYEYNEKDELIIQKVIKLLDKRFIDVSNK